MPDAAPVLLLGPATTTLRDGTPADILGVALRLAALGVPAAFAAAAAADRTQSAQPAALVLGISALHEAKGRTALTAARKAALQTGVPVVIHVGEPADWPAWAGDGDWVTATRPLLRDAALVVAGEEQARALVQGEEEDEPARAIALGGAKLAVVTGPDGVVMAGEQRSRGATTDLPLHHLTAGLLAALASSRWYPPAAAAALPHLVR